MLPWFPALQQRLKPLCHTKVAGVEAEMVLWRSKSRPTVSLVPEVHQHLYPLAISAAGSECVAFTRRHHQVLTSQSAPASSPSKMPTNFLSLPGEIRNEIYRHLQGFFWPTKDSSHGKMPPYKERVADIARHQWSGHVLRDVEGQGWGSPSIVHWSCSRQIILSTLKFGRKIVMEESCNILKI